MLNFSLQMYNEIALLTKKKKIFIYLFERATPEREKPRKVFHSLYHSQMATDARTETGEARSQELHSQFPHGLQGRKHT